MTLNSKPPTDTELVLMLTQGKDVELGFRFLLQKYQKKVYWQVQKMVLSHEDANDLTQDIFIKIWQNLNKFRSEAQLSTWIFRIAHNETLNFIAKNKKNSSSSIENLQIEGGSRADEIDLNGEEIQNLLKKAILTLPEKQRAVFNLKYYDEMTYEQISEITDTSVGALKASYHLAVKKIEAFLNNETM